MGSRGRGGLRLGVLSVFDPWDSPLCVCPFKYSLNPYTGCSIGCRYCYATAYIGVKPSTPKRSLVRRLERDLGRIPPGSLVNIGTSSDPYPPEEEELGLTRVALEVLTPRGYRLLITTKGTLYAWRDLDILSRANAAVTPSITGLDGNTLLRVVEPGAPGQGERIEAAAAAVKAGVPVGVRVDPVIPYVNDDPYELRELVAKLAMAGVRFIVTSTYKARPDNLSRMRRALGAEAEKLYRLYRERGVYMHGYIYLPEDLRRSLLKPVIEEAARLGLEYATCREGFTGRTWFKAGSCDGSHLIPTRVRPERALALERWMGGEGS
ncbi:DNA repair photolyase [Aeropyrum camini SY1 = JCM 12091]|uniref:DNA repair photolyase n=1 Tax=Aeropyrum camini SY1 = JCM 12091 TaxID=1198449 RepID=U3TDM4_9CREN|nr:radical SAM protein [Aeropyrum camini]BAN90078.1 DNA repair photolyase [Aeropyrum camini SY1 = JCM 12091]